MISSTLNLLTFLFCLFIAIGAGLAINDYLKNKFDSIEELKSKLSQRGLDVKVIRLPEMEQDLAGSRKIVSKILDKHHQEQG